MDVGDAENGTRRQRAVGVWVTGALAIALLASPGSRSVWPFSHWWLYHDGTPHPVRSISVVELRVARSDGQGAILWPRDLFTLDDDSSGQDSGPWLISRVLDPREPARSAYEKALWARVEHVLHADVATIEFCELEWSVNFDKHPALNREAPTKATTVFRLSR